MFYNCNIKTNIIIIIGDLPEQRKENSKNYLTLSHRVTKTVVEKYYLDKLLQDAGSSVGQYSVHLFISVLRTSR